MITNQETQAMHQKPPNSIKPTPPQNHKPNKKGIHYQDEKHGLIALDELRIPGPHRSSASSDVGAIVFDHMLNGLRLQSDRLINTSNESPSELSRVTFFVEGMEGVKEREIGRGKNKKVRNPKLGICRPYSV